MSDVVGIGNSRRLIDSDGDALDDGAGRLNVNVSPGLGSTLLRSYPQFDAATLGETLTAGLGIVAITTCKEIIIQADFDNTAYVMVGDAALAADTEGIRLHAGDMLTLPISSTDAVSVRGSTSSQNINVLLVLS